MQVYKTSGTKEKDLNVYTASQVGSCDVLHVNGISSAVWTSTYNDSTKCYLLSNFNGTSNDYLVFGINIPGAFVQSVFSMENARYSIYSPEFSFHGQFEKPSGISTINFRCFKIIHSATRTQEADFKTFLNQDISAFMVGVTAFNGNLGDTTKLNVPPTSNGIIQLMDRDAYSEPFYDGISQRSVITANANIAAHFVAGSDVFYFNSLTQDTYVTTRVVIFKDSFLTANPYLNAVLSNVSTTGFFTALAVTNTSNMLYVQAGGIFRTGSIVLTDLPAGYTAFHMPSTMSIGRMKVGIINGNYSFLLKPYGQ